MFGLEKSPKEKFDFDLEVELKKDHKKAQALFKRIENNINEIKKQLKQGSSSEELNKLGELMQGYTALLKVLKKSQKS